jgi:hypothetical protein
MSASVREGRSVRGVDASDRDTPLVLLEWNCRSFEDDSAGMGSHFLEWMAVFRRSIETAKQRAAIARHAMRIPFLMLPFTSSFL